ncbi:hypothetical protein D9615_005263 [Tricholomella constricta]|uniref:Uncharacterized protein n=1 Tax=Tricholomella constricta TaxID=117010 RepID=A0A8H5H6K6_9AGAR|nr:hypothetical protein D9615_005263 [Tricholomella constricta]
MMLSSKLTRRFWQSSRVYSTIVRSPPRSAPREVPTPLVFVSAKDWDVTSSNGATYLSSMLAEKGYTCLQIDLALPAGPITDSAKLMRHFESRLGQEIRLSTMPFPPVIFARSSACLIAQTYISSHPASGLCLISPPLSNASVPKSQLPTDLPEFNFEPKFPIGIVATAKELELFRANHRLGDDPVVDTISVPNVEGSEALVAIDKWLDELGI